MSGMTDMTENIKERVNKFVFENQPIHHIKHSLYQCGTENFIILTRTSLCEIEQNYFLGITINYLNKAHFVVFVCWKDRCAFKVPTEILTALNLSRASSRDRYVTTIYSDPIDKSWFLTFNKNSSGTKIDITKYKINLLTTNEYEQHFVETVIQQNLALRKRLFNR